MSVLVDCQAVTWANNGSIGWEAVASFACTPQPSKPFFLWLGQKLVSLPGQSLYRSPAIPNNLRHRHREIHWPVAGSEARGSWQDCPDASVKSAAHCGTPGRIAGPGRRLAGWLHAGRNPQQPLGQPTKPRFPGRFHWGRCRVGKSSSGLPRHPTPRLVCHWSRTVGRTLGRLDGALRPARYTRFGELRCGTI